MTPLDHALGLAGIVLVTLGVVAGATFLVATPSSPVRDLWRKHILELDRETRFLFLATSGPAIARYQLIVGIVIAIVAAVLGQWVLLFILPVVAFVPGMDLRRRHDARVVLLQKQLDTWLVMLANALKATPSLGEALASTSRIMHPPMSQELDLTNKEIQLGTPLDQALRNMGDRIRSKSMYGAITTILVGRQTGGDLSRILEESAAMLREMARLEGVVRTKTAEARAQLLVLAAMPFLVVVALNYIDPHFMDPLFTESGGTAVIVVAVALYVGALLVARKTLAVDV